MTTPARIPLEDSVDDILAKACRGLGCGAELALLPENPTPGDFHRVATALNLHATALAAIAYGAYVPDAGCVPEGVAMTSTPFADMMVNSYVLWDPCSGEAAAFDTGSDCDEAVALARTRGLKIRQIFLTHAHGDHIYDLDRLKEKTGAQAWSSEPVEGATLFEPGRDFAIGALRVGTRLTCGHSPRGTTYVIEGPTRPVAVVGDALFAGSMGGPQVSYQQCLETARSGIFTLPSDTLVCPGHGPLTTVGNESLHNPFFAPFFAAASN